MSVTMKTSVFRPSTDTKNKLNFVLFKSIHQLYNNEKH